MSFERKSSHLAELSAIVERGSGDHTFDRATSRLARWLCSAGAVEELAREVAAQTWRQQSHPDRHFEAGQFSNKNWKHYTRMAETILSTVAQHALEGE